jgi:hypothetical protein
VQISSNEFRIALLPFFLNLPIDDRGPEAELTVPLRLQAAGSAPLQGPSVVLGRAIPARDLAALPTVVATV